VTQTDTNDFNRLLKRAQGRVRRWQIDRGNTQRIARLTREVAVNSQAVDDSHPVVFLNASTRLSRLNLNASFSLLSSWAVRLAGVPAVHFICQQGLKPCVLGTNRISPGQEPPCSECMALSNALYTGAQTSPFSFLNDVKLDGLLQRISPEDLPGFEYEGLPLGAMVLPSLRWILRRHHLENDDSSNYLYRQYILSAWSTAQQFSKLLDETQPRALVVFNGMFFPETTARRLALARGIPVYTHEVALRPNTAFFTPGDATAYPIDIPDDFELTPEQDARLDSYLEKRLQGNFSMAGIRFWPEMRSLDPSFWQRAGQFRQIVPVFTNVVFDTSQGHANVVFSDMFAWLDQVLAIIRAHPETFFVLRAHPDETRPGKESRESVAEWVRNNRVDQLPNVQFVGAQEYFSSYELIQRSKFVLIYNSTIGLEAAIMGASVLSGGKARFTQYPMVFFPQTPKDFACQAEEFLNAETVQAPPEFRWNARRFLYYQLYCTALPFDRYIEDDGIWRGYVRFKDFSWRDLLPENNPTMRVIVNGILNNQPFLMDE
jgi:hypothetical protein